MPKLTVMIPTLESRKHYLRKLLSKLEWQQQQLHNPNDVEIIICSDNGEQTTGHKRNFCVDTAKGIAMAFIDDDDDITDRYLQKGVEFADSDKDVASLIGLYFNAGVYDRPFHHSLKYTTATHDSKMYYRAPLHINFVKREKVKHIKYPEKNIGEDGTWMDSVVREGVLKTEFEIKETLYLYYAGKKPF